MSYKIFYINLDEAKDRNEYMQKQLKLNFPNVVTTRFSAINKNELTNDYIKSLLNPRSYYYLETNNHKRAIHEDINSKGHIACYLSHLTLWKKLVEDNDVDYYIIFEDDNKIDSSLQNKIESILKNNVKFDFISLIYISRRNNDIKSTVYPDFYKILNPFWGMQCYILNKKCANTLIKWSKVLTCQVDGFVGYVALYEKELDFYFYKYSLGSSNMFASQLSHGNCLHCQDDDSFRIKIKSGFSFFRNSTSSPKSIEIKLETILIFVFILLVIYLYRKSKNRPLQLSS